MGGQAGMDAPGRPAALLRLRRRNAGVSLRFLRRVEDQRTFSRRRGQAPPGTVLLRLSACSSFLQKGRRGSCLKPHPVRKEEDRRRDQACQARQEEEEDARLGVHSPTIRGTGRTAAPTLPAPWILRLGPGLKDTCFCH